MEGWLDWLLIYVVVALGFIWIIVNYLSFSITLKGSYFGFELEIQRLFNACTLAC